MSTERFPIVEVTWADSCSLYGWKSLKDYKEDTLVKCKSVGYLIDKSKGRISILQSLTESGGASDSIMIPKNCVQKITVLKKGRK